MILYKRKKIRFIVSIAVLLFLPLFGNAATTEESEEEILFITSYNSDTKYTYDNISTFIETYTQLGGRYSIMVENMNATDLTQAHQWKKTLTDILDKHPKAKLVILLGGEAWSSFLHLEDEKYKQPPVFCAMASRNGIRIPEDSTDIRSYNPESINLMERMKEYNVRYCSTYEYDIKKDIEMIQDFYPETEHLVFVSDNTYNGLAELAWFKKNLQHFPQLSITYVDGRIHTLDMAASQLRNLPRNTVMLLGIWRIDNRGITYMNNSVYAFSKANPLLPMFSMTSTSLPFSCADGTAAASYRRPSARSRTTAQTSRRAPSPTRSAPGVHVGHRISMPYSDSPNRPRERPLIRSANAVSHTNEWTAPTPVRARRHRALPSVNRPPTRAARRWDSGRTGTRRRARRSTSPRPRRPPRRAGRCNRCARHFRA